MSLIIIVIRNNTDTFYDCRLSYSSLAVFDRSNPSSLAASIVGIVLLFVTVAYIWLVQTLSKYEGIIIIMCLASDFLAIANFVN